jgi:hypothetical protein
MGSSLSWSWPVVVVDDPQDLDEAEGGSQPAQGRLLAGVDLGHGPGRLPPWWLVASGPQVQVDPAALPSTSSTSRSQ